MQVRQIDMYIGAHGQEFATEQEAKNSFRLLEIYPLFSNAYDDYGAVIRTSEAIRHILKNKSKIIEILSK